MSRSAVKQRFSIIGNAERLDQAIDISIQVAPTEVTVLVIGENGSGKDVFARIIHSLSLRKHKPFMAINCGAIPEGTIDSELFGHEKGSFTSAFESRKGYFEEANGGVLFLDEIAELPLSTQARLLRVLENGEFLRVGSSKVQKTDVRVIAATNKNLIDAIRQGRFREDLYFRLNTIMLSVPPLRERGEDLELLFRYFANEFGDRYGRSAVRLLPDAVLQLHKYHWPGNVRELRNFTEKLTVLTQEKDIDALTLRSYLPVSDSQLPIVSPFHNETRSNQHSGEQSSGQSYENYEFIIKALLDLKQEMFEMRRAVASLVSDRFTQEQPMNARLSLDRYLPESRNSFSSQQGVDYDSPHTVSDSRYSDSGNRDDHGGDEPSDGSDELYLKSNEKELIARALNKHKNNRKRAAVELGISERTLYRKIRSYGLDE